MTPVKKILFKPMVLFLCTCTLFSCSSFGFFKKGENPVSQEAAVPETDTQEENKENLIQELENKNQNISVLENKILSLEKQVSDLEQQLATQKPVVYQVAYTKPSQLYQKARNLLLEGELTKAAQLFETFVDQHPNHSLADNAMYWLGECHYSSGQYAKAVTIFKTLVTAYPKAEKVPDALLKTGYAYLSMDDINRGHHYLKLVLTKYPFSPAAEMAQKKLKEVE